MMTLVDDAVGPSVLLFLQTVTISGLLWYSLKGLFNKMREKEAGGLTASLAASDLGRALFLRRSLSRAFRLRLRLLMAVYGSRYQQDSLFFVRVLAEGFGIALGKKSGRVPAYQELHQWCLYLLGREFPNLACNEAVVAFLLRGMTRWDVELLFWLNIGQPGEGEGSAAQV